MFLFKCILAALADVEDRCHVHLVEGGKHGRGLLRFDQAAGNREPSARHALALHVFALVRRGFARCRLRWLRLALRRCCTMTGHIGLTNPADRITGANLAEVDAALPCQLACARRCQCSVAVATCCRHFGRGYRRGGCYCVAACRSRFRRFGFACSGLRRTAACGSNDADGFANGYVLARLTQDGGDDTLHLCTNFQIDFIRFQLSEHIALTYRVAFFNQPFVDGSFGYGFSQIGY
ncbi:hypothetical protein D3C75_608750 [compost metagenome]